MRLGLNCLAIIQAVSQFLCSNQSMICGNAFIGTETPALLDHVPGRHRIELRPGAGTRCRAIHCLDVRASWPQCGEVDAHAASACHDLGHEFEVVEDTLAAVFGAGDDETIVVCYSVSRPCACENAAAGHKLEVGERLVKTLLPRGLQFFGRFHSGNTPCHPRP